MATSPRVQRLFVLGCGLTIVVFLHSVADRVGRVDTWTGQITCSICGPKRATRQAGAAMTDRECTLGCVKNGARFGLVVAQEYYDIINQHEPAVAEHAGAMVQVLGRRVGTAIEVRQVRDEVVPLGQVFPAARTFSEKQGTPPHFMAYAEATPANGNGRSAGFVFWTTDLVPDVRGFEGPIPILVGLDGGGRITGVVVRQNAEPYGYFSIDTPEFARQFSGKSIGDPFKSASTSSPCRERQ